MKDGSGKKENSLFAKIPKYLEIILFAGWLLATTLLIFNGAQLYRIASEVFSIALLSVSLFNIFIMIGFSATKRNHFEFGLFFIRIAYILLASASLAISFFVAGIRIR